MEPKNELQKNAIAVARRKELEVFQRALDVQWLNNRMEDSRMGRCLALIKREAEMEKDFQERTDHAAIVNARAEKETGLAYEITKVRREEACELLRRHYLRERDPSLQVLAKKLQAGYVCRDLRQQILHNEYKRLQEKAEDKIANGILLKSLFNEQEAKTNEEKEKFQRTTQYCKDLQQQLVNRQLQKQCQYEDTLIEKKMLEDIMRTMADEDKRELEQKHRVQQKIRNEMVTFQKARDAWRLKQKEMVIIEERKIEEQNKMAADRSSAIVAERERIQQLKDANNKKIVDKILADEAAQKERDDLIKLLQEQEYLEKNHLDDIAPREKLERVRNDTNTALTTQMETKKRLAKEMRVKEAEFRKKTEAKMLADEAKEREKEQKKREQGKLYSQQLRKQIQENAIRRKADEKLEADRAKYVWDFDRKWQEEVSEERKKMIEEHAPPLLGYLQTGVLVKTDLDAVRAGVSKRDDMKGIDIDRMFNASRPPSFAKCNPQCRILREY